MGHARAPDALIAALVERRRTCDQAALMKREAIGLQVSLDVAGRRALVIGGGAVAEDKTLRLLDGEAAVTVVTETPSAALVALGAAGRIDLEQRALRDSDCTSADLVLVCEHDAALARRVAALVAVGGGALWADDDPEVSHFAMPALARLGRARIAVSTAGGAPALASRVRVALERDLGVSFARFVDELAAARAAILVEEPDRDRRRDRLRALLEGFELELRARYPRRQGP